MICMNGAVTIVFTINFLKLMRILTMQKEVSFLLMLVGCSWKNTHQSLWKENQLIVLICSMILLFGFKRGKKHLKLSVWSLDLKSHYRFYLIFYLFFCFILPATIPVYFWSESWFNSIMISVFWRYCTSLHCTWFVNSAAHMWGDRPFNTDIEPRENWLVSFGAFGEGKSVLIWFLFNIL